MKRTEISPGVYLLVGRWTNKELTQQPTKTDVCWVGQGAVEEETSRGWKYLAWDSPDERRPFKQLLEEVREWVRHMSVLGEGWSRGEPFWQGGQCGHNRAGKGQGRNGETVGNRAGPWGYSKAFGVSLNELQSHQYRHANSSQLPVHGLWADDSAE